jgi:hypothetical protein
MPPAHHLMLQSTSYRLCQSDAQQVFGLPVNLF